MSPGNGSAAILTAGTGTGQWRADFDSTTTETEPIIATATFRYTSYSIHDVKVFD